MTGWEGRAVRVEVADAIGTVWLHRPHRHNAWTGTMHAEYLDALARLEADPTVRCIVVTGTPPAFCVGGDSEALAGHAERGGYDPGLPAERARPAPDRPAALDADFAFQLALRVPVVAAVNGACAGVGLAVALFADLRFGAAGAKCTTAAPRLGLPAEYGTSWILPRLVGATRAADLLLSGRVFTPAETETWGLWNGVAADGDGALGMAHAWARALAVTGPRSTAVTKAQLWGDVDRTAADAVDRSMVLLREAMTGDEYREGVAALRDRRPPSFAPAVAPDPSRTEPGATGG